MIVYIAPDYKCHVENDGTMTAVENEFFDGKCRDFIEGYCLVPAGAEYKGNIATGTMIFPWKDYTLLQAAQSGYENCLADAQAAYAQGVNSI